MSSKLKNFGLIGLGVIAGIAGSMQFEASAQKHTSPLPLEELLFAWFERQGVLR